MFSDIACSQQTERERERGRKRLLLSYTEIVCALEKSSRRIAYQAFGPARSSLGTCYFSKISRPSSRISEILEKAVEGEVARSSGSTVEVRSSMLATGLS